jgi:Glucodextranase, domain B
MSLMRTDVPDTARPTPRSLSAALSVAIVATAALTASCGSDDTPGSAPPTPQIVYAGARTTAPASVAAGDTVVVSCVLVDAQGNASQPAKDADLAIVFAPSDSVPTDASGKTIAVRAGRVDVRCTFPSLGVGDDVGAQMAITPGPVASVDTALSATSVVAGGEVTATCTAHDAFGNVVPDAKPSLASAPTDAGNVVTGLKGNFVHAGVYDLACTVAGAKTHPVPIEVVPGPPASLVVTPNPMKTLYPVGSVVTLETLVADQYNNPIGDAPRQYGSAPGASTTLGSNHFQYLANGFYTLSATVAPPTSTGLPLVSQVQIEVGGSGPAIECEGPKDGAMINAAPGSAVVFNGSVNSPNGVTSVSVNGAPATLSGTAFSAPVTARFGINFADVVATDKNGAQSTRTCSFLAANQWALEGGLYADTVDLKLTQAAVDDGARGGGVNSFGDMLYAVANSQGLANTLDSALKASNPLKPEACDSQTCTIFGCICWYSSGVEYQALSLPGPQTVDLTLVDGGLRAHAYVPNLATRLRVHGDVGPIPYDTTGWVTFSYLDVTMTLDTQLSGGRLHASIRPGTVVTNVGTVSTAFSGVDGWIINNVLVPLAQGTIKDEVKTLVTNYIANNFNSVLDGVLSGLDISTLGTSFNVPRLDVGWPIPLSFGVGLSSLSATPSRMLIGLSSKFSAPAAQALPSLGVAIPTGTVVDDMTVGAPSSTGVAVHVGVFNQALHALWRGGMFSATLNGSQLGNGLPAAASVHLNALLPPVAALSGSVVELSLGAMQLQITYPGLFGGTDGQGNPLPPLDVELGARATSTPTLVGNDLKFGALTITELHFSTGDVSLDASTNQIVTSLLRTLLQRVIDQSLNDALPALPIPSFQLPASLLIYGVGPGSLALVNPSLGFDPRDFVLRGRLGVQ